MPHLIIEYTPDKINDEHAAVLVDTVFKVTVDSGLFDTANIKVRAVPVKVYRLGLVGEGMVCVQCRIHRGRNTMQKKQLSDAVVGAVRKIFPDVAVVTAEVIEMERASYSRDVNQPRDNLDSV